MRAIFDLLISTARDLVPILVIVGVFQILVIRQPVEDIGSFALGFVFVLLGLAVFVRGLDMALFPLGETLANALATRGSLPLLIIFAFGLGFGTTVAEPALIAVGEEAAGVLAMAGVIPEDAASQVHYADSLRYTVAVSVGASLVIGVFRILKGWPVYWFMIGSSSFC